MGCIKASGENIGRVLRPLPRLVLEQLLAFGTRRYSRTFSCDVRVRGQVLKLAAPPATFMCINWFVQRPFLGTATPHQLFPHIYPSNAFPFIPTSFILTPRTLYNTKRVTNSERQILSAAVMYFSWWLIEFAQRRVGLNDAVLHTAARLL